MTLRTTAFPTSSRRTILRTLPVHACGSSTTRLYTHGDKKIAIVGGGASGIFSAIAAAEQGQRNQVASNNNHISVTVLEGTSNTLSKVKISGGGRCNVLHDTSKPVSQLLLGYPRGRKELHGTLQTRFTPTMAQAWFERRGVELKTEGDGRMFPSTDSSQTIIDVLLDAAERAGVNIRRRCKVESVQYIDDDVNQASKFRVVVQSKETGRGGDSKQQQQQELEFDSVILATGSMPIGYRLAQELGHELVDPVPSLFTLNAKHEVAQDEGLLHGLSGVSVPWAQVSFRCAAPKATPGKEQSERLAKKPKKKKPTMVTQEGPLLITHHGLSGPAVLRLSAFGARELNAANYRGTLRIQWCPALGKTDDIFNQLWQLTTARPKKQVASSCPFFLPNSDGGSTNDQRIATTTTSGNEASSSSSAIPKRLWSAMAKRAGVADGQTWGQVSKKLVRKLAMQINECEMEITGKGTFKEEFVTAGGVSLKDIDMKTMQSKKCPGLFFCGELINVDGVTGGFNFLNAWSSGYVAGNSAADLLLEQQQEQQQFTAPNATVLV